MPHQPKGSFVSGSLKAEIEVIRRSGLFLADWYRAQRPEATGDGVEHFCNLGWRAGARPNPYFDTAWYLAQNPDIAAAGVNPLLHYHAFGEAAGRDPAPWFQVSWYRAAYERGAGPCLAHFLERRFTGQVNPVPIFDGAYYLDTNDDVAAGGADPFEHFMVFGAAEGRNPAADFDVNFYRNRYAHYLNGENPLLHFLEHRHDGLFLPQRPDHEGLVPGAVRAATRPAAWFEEFRPLPPGSAPRAKLLAYYLPQYHAIPENDAWWGRGFTDWTNLGRALPRFVGHQQPRVPRDLGYYDLSDPRTLPRQIEMAKAAGLHGFVFYTYWFNGHRLLEGPLEQLLADPALDFPFCAMWANENWTRRWDGLEREILIAQDYRARDDAALVAHFARLFADARYIRVAGRPLLMMYRVTLIPDAARRIARWRTLFREQHGEDPLLVMAQSLGDSDPAPYGLDGAIEFPPHMLSQNTPKLNAELDLLDPEFIATVHDYAAIAETSLRTPSPPYPLIKTLCPGWDNEPRREGKGLVLTGATPALYQDWLERLIGYAQDHPFYGEPLIGVNAWNEWAEGAYLEPDTHAGAAYLNATARALCPQVVAGIEAGILLVGHDAHPHGAQMLLLHIARALRRRHGVAVHILLIGVGALMDEYRAAGEVTIAHDATIIGHRLDEFRARGLRHAIVNSAAAAKTVPWLAKRGFTTTLLVHEMPQLLTAYNLEIQARLGAAAAASVIAAAPLVAERFRAAIDLPDLPIAILPQGNYQRIGFDAEASTRLRAALGLGAADFLILGAGLGDLRKGFDLFMQLADQLLAARGDIHLLWVGDLEAAMRSYTAPQRHRAAATGRFHHLEYRPDIAGYFSAADVLVLPSREDPYPTVVLEALACGVPCVAFDEAGGIPELLRREAAGAVARFADVPDMAAKLTGLLDHDRLAATRPRLAAMAAERFDFGAYAAALLGRAVPGLATVSVAVINYNYATYLAQRLRSLFDQTYPVHEILLLDDASTDDSLAVARAAAETAERDLTILTAATNSGSPFAQWRRAAAAATGDYVWLAEADDLAAPGFLARLVEAIAGRDIVLAFCDSAAIDETGAATMRSYKSYYFDSGAPFLARAGAWPAADFARLALTRRNLIPNVSAVLWRRDALRAALAAVPDLEDWKLAGDWRLYLAALTAGAGEVVYLDTPLNTHRRHAGGVTARLPAAAHVAEIAAAQAVAADLLGLDAAARADQAADLARVAAELGAAPPAPAKIARRRKV
jgi:glycosyltransferase involved in cell wall biosynthesis